MRLVERWRVPHLRDLDAHFVPRETLARNLVWCRLEGIDEARFGALQEFLCVAKSLQHLEFLCSEDIRHFYEACDLPSPQSLLVDFVPHTPLPKHLVQFRLFEDWEHDIPLSELIDFLSSSNAVEELAFGGSCDFSEDPDTSDVLPAVTMPSLVMCELPSYETALPLIARLRLPTLRTLKLNVYGLLELTTITRNEFRTSLQSMRSLEGLELNGDVGVDYLYEVVGYAPPHLESFSLKEYRFFVTGTDETRWNTSHPPNRKLIHFDDCMYLYPTFTLDFVDYLRAVGLGEMQI